MDEDATLENALGAAQGNFDIYRSCLIENDGFTERKKQVDCVCAQQETVRSGITKHLCNPASFPGFGFGGP